MLFRKPRPGHPFLGGAPVLAAHRGGAALAPENTMTAFRRAVGDWDADMLEMDVRLTADGRVVVLHDATVDRTTDGSGPVRDMPWDAVRQLDAGYRFRDPAGEFPYRSRGVRIPLFDEVLDEMPKMRIMVEPKVAEAAGPLVEVIRVRGAEHRVLIGAEFERTRDGARGYGGPMGASRNQVLTFWLLHRVPGIGRWYVPAIDAFQVPERSGRYRVVTPAFVRAAHRANIPVHVWTVDDPADMRRLLEWGVDGIQTDRPDLLADLLTEVSGRPPAPARVREGGR
ncbi:MAG: glycerophosphodiester phosphodiesterase [Gemmatimonadetes bacterium]|nr:glycerophosphodiester phosphodiesterase [Gemmatimonadota bacterium]MYB97388.1 glycerophosphodiester phosphodiesterase [Gemmatimonadota bacterium]